MPKKNIKGSDSKEFRSALVFERLNNQKGIYLFQIQNLKVDSYLSKHFHKKLGGFIAIIVRNIFFYFSSIVAHFIHLESMVACTHCARKNPSKVTYTSIHFKAIRL